MAYDGASGIDWEALGDAIGDFLANALDSVTDGLSDFGDWMSEFGNSLLDGANDLLDSLGETLSDAADSVGEFINALGNFFLGLGDLLPPLPSWPELPFPIDFPNFFDPPISPLVLDLDGDGVELVALSASGALFDLDGDGFAQHTGWVAANDALLAIDRNGNGRIDDIGEVFGNGTTDGFTELRALDSNADDRIDANDSQFDELLLWRDQNGNGWSEEGELQSLAVGGVRSIDLSATNSGTINAGHRISHTSSYTRTDGTTASIVDAWFENDRHIASYLPADGFALHRDVFMLPELSGYGVVPSLSIATTLDAGLRTLVTDLMRSSDTLSFTDFRTRVLAIVLDWTGLVSTSLTRVPAGRT